MVRGEAEKCLWPAAVFDAAFLQDVAKRPLFFENLPPRLRFKAVQVNLDGSEFNRLVRAVEEQHHFAEIAAPFAPAAQQPQMNVAPIIFLQRRRHVVVVHEQLFVRLRHSLAIHLLQRRQSQAHLRIKLVQRMRERRRRNVESLSKASGH